MIRFGLLFLTLMLSYSSFGQTKEFFDKDVVNAQRRTVAGAVYGLKIDRIDLILQFFEKDIENLEAVLEECVLEIDKFQESTTLSDIVMYDEGSHVFRCRYFDDERARFQIDLYLKPNDPNSKIIKIVITKDEVLKEEHKRRINSVGIPPPPPPPPPIKKKTKNY